jgi:hypothetical protein
MEEDTSSDVDTAPLTQRQRRGREGATSSHAGLEAALREVSACLESANIQGARSARSRISKLLTNKPDKSDRLKAVDAAIRAAEAEIHRRKAKDDAAAMSRANIQNATELLKQGNAAEARKAHTRAVTLAADAGVDMRVELSNLEQCIISTEETVTLMDIENAEESLQINDLDTSCRHRAQAVKSMHQMGADVKERLGRLDAAITQSATNTASKAMQLAQSDMAAKDFAKAQTALTQAMTCLKGIGWHWVDNGVRLQFEEVERDLQALASEATSVASSVDQELRKSADFLRQGEWAAAQAALERARHHLKQGPKTMHDALLQRRMSECFSLAEAIQTAEVDATAAEQSRLASDRAEEAQIIRMEEADQLANEEWAVAWNMIFIQNLPEAHQAHGRALQHYKDVGVKQLDEKRRQKAEEISKAIAVAEAALEEVRVGADTESEDVALATTGKRSTSEVPSPDPSTESQSRAEPEADIATVSPSKSPSRKRLAQHDGREASAPPDTDMTETNTVANVGDIEADLDSVKEAAGLASTGKRLTVEAALHEPAAASPVGEELDTEDGHASPSNQPAKRRSAQQDFQ